jgi:glucose dehydrogenase
MFRFFLNKKNNIFNIFILLFIFFNIFFYLLFNYLSLDILRLKTKNDIFCYYQDKYSYIPNLIKFEDCNKNNKYILKDKDLVKNEIKDINQIFNRIEIGNKKESTFKKILKEDNSWARSHKDNNSNKKFNSSLIKNKDIKNLKVVWKFDLLGDTKSKNFVKKIYNHIFYFYTGINPKYFNKKSYGANPIYYKKNLFLPDLNGNMISINGENGKKNWATKIVEPVAKRGAVIDPLNEHLYVSSGNGIYILNLNDGKIIDILKVNKNNFFSKQTNKYGVDTKSGDNVFFIPPIKYKNQLIAANMNAEIISFSLDNNKINWKLPIRKDDFNKGANPWSAMSFDEKREEIYLVTGNPENKLESYMLGINRNGDNLFSNSVICIDANNGKIKWYFQDTTHDLWGLDLSFPPILTSLFIDDKKIDVLVVVGKSGNTFILNRENGKNIHNYENIKVKKSTIINENSSTYQKKSIFPKPLINMEITKKELSDLSPEINQHVNEIYESGESGYYHPPILNKKIFYRGLSGGGQWYGGVVNDNGILYVPINNIPWFGILNLKKSNNKIYEYNEIKDVKLDNNYFYHGYRGYFYDQYNNFATKPPWGLIYAINLKSGKILWSRPYGKIKTKLGDNKFTTVNGSPIWGGISVLNNSIIASGSFDSKIYFYDTNNGDEIHSLQLDAPGSSPPSIYEIDERVYIAVVAVGAAQKINTGRYIYGISN